MPEYRVRCSNCHARLKTRMIDQFIDNPPRYIPAQVFYCPKCNPPGETRKEEKAK